MQSINNFDDDEEIMSDINITPMVDVMLVLMLIFLITAPILTNNISLTLPKTEQNNKISNDNKTINIYIDRDNNYFLNKSKVKSPQELISKLINFKTNKVKIYAHKDTPYQSIAIILNKLEKNNITNISLVTQAK